MSLSQNPVPYRAQLHRLEEQSGTESRHTCYESFAWAGMRGVPVLVNAYGASLLTTYVPARQASNVYPAEALRYEYPEC